MHATDPISIPTRGCMCVCPQALECGVAVEGVQRMLAHSQEVALRLAGLPTAALTPAKGGTIGAECAGKAPSALGGGGGSNSRAGAIKGGDRKGSGGGGQPTLAAEGRGLGPTPIAAAASGFTAATAGSNGGRAAAAAAASLELFASGGGGGAAVGGGAAAEGGAQVVARGGATAPAREGRGQSMRKGDLSMFLSGAWGVCVIVCACIFARMFVCGLSPFAARLTAHSEPSRRRLQPGTAQTLALITPLLPTQPTPLSGCPNHVMAPPSCTSAQAGRAARAQRAFPIQCLLRYSGDL